MAKVDLQDIVECFAASEKLAVDLIAELGHIPRCLDTAARDANAAGLDVRAFEMGAYHMRLAGVIGSVARALEDLEAIHTEVYKQARGLELPVPSPKSGGR